MTYREMLEKGIGFGYLGNNVRIDPTVVFFNPYTISIGDNSRIDAYSIISAGSEGVFIGKHTHIAARVTIIGSGGHVRLEDYTGLSGGCFVYTATDDYVGGYMTNPTIPDKFKNVKTGNVTLRKHVVVGAGSIIMPNVELGLGSSVGALSFIRKNVEPFNVVMGNPAKYFCKRKEKILELEKEFEKEKKEE